MATYLIVDGYNLIGVKGTMKGDLEAQRSRLILDLTRYHEIKGYPIVVVFDGWGSDDFGGNEQAYGGGVRVIFSRHGEKADAVIKRLALKLKSGCVVVSSDREVARYAEANNAVAVPAGEFGRRLHAALQNSGREDEEPEPAPSVKRGNPRRLSKIERKRQRKLGRL